MKRYKNADSYQNDIRSVVTIGTFDGVHVGHQKIIERVVETAKRSQMESAILTFFPHPRMVLQKDSDIKLINTIEERVQIFERLGIHNLIVHPFTREFSRLSAQDYVEQLLVQNLNVGHVIIGYDHRFGRNRTANIADLATFGMQHNFTIEEISKQDIDDVAVSSTKIRTALGEGNVKLANQYLNYNFMLTGMVVRGKEIGRTLNYPTANIKIEESYKLVPKNGVYIVRSQIDNKMLYGMTNIGVNPTVGGTERSIETHFFDTSANLYDKNIQIELLDRIRDEKVFPSVHELKEAMQEDEDYARDFINSLL